GFSVGLRRVNGMSAWSVHALDALLEEVWGQDGTDLLLTAGAPPLARVNGEIVPLTAHAAALRPEASERLIKSILTEVQCRLLDEGKELDFSFNWKGLARFRGNAFHQR